MKLAHKDKSCTATSRRKKRENRVGRELAVVEARADAAEEKAARQEQRKTTAVWTGEQVVGMDGADTCGQCGGAEYGRSRCLERRRR